MNQVERMSFVGDFLGFFEIDPNKTKEDNIANIEEQIRNMDSEAVKNAAIRVLSNTIYYAKNFTTRPNAVKKFKAQRSSLQITNELFNVATSPRIEIKQFLDGANSLSIMDSKVPISMELTDVFDEKTIRKTISTAVITSGNEFQKRLEKEHKKVKRQAKAIKKAGTKVTEDA